MKNISKDTVDLLNKGVRESSNLMEFLSVDLEILLKNILPEFNCPVLPPKLGVTKKHLLITEELQKQFGFNIFTKFKSHKSDTIRTFACYLIGAQELPFTEKLQLLYDLADDSNSGVREWAWIAIREEFAANLTTSIDAIIPWTAAKSANIRRFASELSRPRGVWCKHISALRKEPWLGLPILLPLRSDSSRYVQLSVGNWLNDAGKDHRDWVVNLCKAWSAESPTIETQKVCKRGLRNINTN